MSEGRSSSKIIAATLSAVILIVIAVFILISQRNDVKSNTNVSTNQTVTSSAVSNESSTTTSVADAIFTSKLFNKTNIAVQIAKYGQAKSDVIDVAYPLNIGKGEVVEFTNSSIKLGLNTLASSACKDLDSNKSTKSEEYKVMSRNGKEVNVAKFKSTESNQIYYLATYSENTDPEGTISMLYCTNLVAENATLKENMSNLIQSTTIDLDYTN